MVNVGELQDRLADIWNEADVSSDINVLKILLEATNPEIDTIIKKGGRGSKTHRIAMERRESIAKKLCDVKEKNGEEMDQDDMDYMALRMGELLKYDCSFF